VKLSTPAGGVIWKWKYGSERVKDCAVVETDTIFPTSLRISPAALGKKYWLFRSRTRRQALPHPEELYVPIEYGVFELATTN